MPTSRAKTNGLVLRHGYIVAEWGDTDAVDPTNDIVIVWRWHSGSPNELIKRVLAALNQ